MGRTANQLAAARLTSIVGQRRQEMSYESATSENFLSTVRGWFAVSPEILALFRFSHAAGNREFEFFTTFDAFKERLGGLPERTCITVFAEPQLPIRGVVDDELIERVLSSLTDGSEYLIVETIRRVYGKQSWFHHAGGDSHEALRQDLEQSRGVPIAVGLYPPWLIDSDTVVSAVVPDAEGNVICGVY